MENQSSAADLSEFGALVRDIRRSRVETGEEFGAIIGLSKGKVSELEQGRYRPGPAVALRLESISGGRIDAAAINEGVRLSRHGLESTPAPALPATGQADHLSGGAVLAETGGVAANTLPVERGE